MNNRQVAENFANGATKSNGSNFFIDGDTLYSYGRHFPVARRMPNGQYLINTDTYSSSTTAHQTYARVELWCKDTISLKDCDVHNIGVQINRDKSDIKNIEGKLSRARSDSMKNVHINTIKELKENVVKLEVLFKSL